jgi:hypothetical protein
MGRVLEFRGIGPGGLPGKLTPVIRRCIAWVDRSFVRSVTHKPDMATPSPAAFTFHRIREQCEQGSLEAWRAFLEFYTPVGIHLLKMYLPTDSLGPERVWEQTLAALAENDFQRFRATEKKSEQEFLVDVRALLLDQALLASPSSPAASAPTLESLAKLLEGLPLLHQEMLFFKLSGYTDASIERMLRMAPRVAQAAFTRLEPDYAAALKVEADRCVWPQPWLVLLAEARAKKQESCAPLHQFLRIHAGQVSWYDKEPIEKHVAGCRRCLEAWAALHEVSYWRKAASAVSAEQIERHLRTLPLAPPPKKSLIQRIFK